MNEPSNHELAKQIAVLEERMNTKQAEYKTDIAQLDKRLATRDTWILLTIFGMMSLGIAILAFIG